ncbi:hypothetical protein QBZ16_004923 [Prototheca wickerhamii]|uniref:Uncharacterized protein n=1 Tax=Prototheca wickerhamii TaxID=3111 RepID=A0AAD9IHK6_PROWI|nr:hypothetical protein QBZ16_004923 [Prototheca wickerhamii]
MKFLSGNMYRGIRNKVKSGLRKLQAAELPLSVRPKVVYESHNAPPEPEPKEESWTIVKRPRKLESSSWQIVGRMSERVGPREDDWTIAARVV